MVAPTREKSPTTTTTMALMEGPDRCFQDTRPSPTRCDDSTDTTTGKVLVDTAAAKDGKADTSMNNETTVTPPRSPQQHEQEQLQVLESSATTILEARVEELETKLKTLSKMLRSQQHNLYRSGSVTIDSKESPPIPRSISPESPSRASVPPLESPHPISAPFQRRLSARLLREDSNPRLPDLGDSFPSPDQPLLQPHPLALVDLAPDVGVSSATSPDQNGGGMIPTDTLQPTQQGQHQNQHQRSAKPPSQQQCSISVPLPSQPSSVAHSEPESDQQSQPNTTPTSSGIRSKWMEYLDNFQETTPDVDLQMEEFVRVPSQVEGLLTFGFLICIDCFLYVITILPIRFVWSVLLLLRTWIWPNVQQHKFHRR